MWRRDQQASTGREQRREITKRLRPARDVLEHLGAQDEIELAAGERRGQCTIDRTHHVHCSLRILMHVEPGVLESHVFEVLAEGLAPTPHVQAAAAARERCRVLL